MPAMLTTTIIGRSPTPLHSSSAVGEMVRRRYDDSGRTVQNVHGDSSDINLVTGNEMDMQISFGEVGADERADPLQPG